MTPDFLLTALIVCISPGTGVVYTLACALSGGQRAALAASIGGTLGTLPHLAASILGLAAVLQASPALFGLLKYAGACYLVYLAWRTIADRSQLEVGSEQTGNFRAIVSRGVAINILNPKLSVFFLAFLPQFVSPESTAATRDMLFLGGIFTLMTLAVFLVYGACAAFARDSVIGRPKVMATLRYGFAACFVGLGGRLLMATA
ncbi:MAG: LysE family translocator [Rhodobacteraceae bacterium]|jgi:threonine/homoserine/homoserine lactone efflux protein|nr:LysE family translocator [Paracoccaceae bacterium]